MFDKFTRLVLGPSLLLVFALFTQTKDSLSRFPANDRDDAYSLYNKLRYDAFDDDARLCCECEELKQQRIKA